MQTATTDRITHLLYLHGFRSSPQSAKAVLLQHALQLRHPNVHWHCPQLPGSPAAASALIAHAVADWPAERFAVVGSSLGGLYATWLAERTGCRAVLLNPAVHAARDLAAQVGLHSMWHDPRTFLEFRSEYVTELRALEVARISHPQRYLAIIAKDDAVLDWQEMAAHYRGAEMAVLQDGGHGLANFSDQLDRIFGFLGFAGKTSA